MGLFTLAVIFEISLSNQGEVLCISDKDLSASEGVGQGTLAHTQCSQMCTLLHMVFAMTAIRLYRSKKIPHRYYSCLESMTVIQNNISKMGLTDTNVYYFIIMIAIVICPNQNIHMHTFAHFNSTMQYCIPKLFGQS